MRAGRQPGARDLMLVNLDRPATLIVHDVELTNLAEHPSWMPELRVYETQVGDDIFCHYTVDEEAELEESDLKTLALMETTRATAGVGVNWTQIRRAWHGSVAEQDCMPWCIYVGAGHKSMGLWHDTTTPFVKATSCASTPC